MCSSTVVNLVVKQNMLHHHYVVGLKPNCLCSQSQKKTNGAPNGFYGDIDWDRYVSKRLTEIIIIIIIM